MEDDTKPQKGATPDGTQGSALADQLNQTTSPNAGGAVSGTKPASGEFEIIFEPEEEAHSGH